MTGIPSTASFVSQSGIFISAPPPSPLAPRHSPLAAGAARRPRMFLWLVVMLGGFILLQALTKSTSVRLRPGKERGDLVLDQHALPSEINGWHMQTFEPAPAPELLPPGQYWWVHQWAYQRDSQTAIVSFDQLGESQWHELTYCYRNQDWTIADRIAYADPEDGSPYIVARLEKNSGAKALLVFSVFFEDGSWATPPHVNLSHLNSKSLRPGLNDRIHERFNPIIMFADDDSRHTRALQCQVLVSGGEPAEPAIVDAAVNLHLASRSQFRNNWLQSRSP